jgi:hypothetical protein
MECALDVVKILMDDIVGWKINFFGSVDLPETHRDD